MPEPMTFESVVTGNGIPSDDSLSEWNGKRVHVHVRQVEDEDDLDVEKEVYFRMPVAKEVLKGVRLSDLGRAEPVIILADDIADE